jgi:hypothetical protein
MLYINERAYYVSFKNGGRIMLKPKVIGTKSALLAGIGIFMFLAANLTTAAASESGCITCHLNKEMLKKTVKVEQGKKSTMQSGAG